MSQLNFSDCVEDGRFEKVLEAAIGIEPMNKGFADLCLNPLGYAALIEGKEILKEQQTNKGFADLCL